MTDERSEEDKIVQHQIDARYWFMQDIQRSGEHTYKKTVYFSADDIQRGKLDQEFFEHKVNDIVSRYPHLIFHVIRNEAASKLFTKEQIATAAKKSVDTDPFHFLFGFDQVADLFSDDEQQELLVRACKSQDATLPVLELATQPFLSRLKDRPEWAGIVSQAIIRSSRSQLHNITKGLEAGVFKPDHLVAAVDRLAADSHSIQEGLNLATTYKEYFNDEAWRKVVDVARAFFKKKEHSSNFYALGYAEGILEQAELEEITWDYLNSFPDQAVSMLSVVASVLGPGAVERWIEAEVDAKSETRMFWGPTAADILEVHLVNPDIKRKYINRMIEVAPAGAIEVLDEIISLYPPDEVKQIVRHILNHASASQVNRFSYHWEKILELEEDEVRNIKVERLRHTFLRDFFSALGGTTDIKKILTADEFFSLVHVKIQEEDPTDFIYAAKDFLRAAQKITTEEGTPFLLDPISPDTAIKVKEVFDHYYAVSPTAWIHTIHEMHEYYQPEEIEQNIWQVSYDLKTVRVAVGAISEWGNLVGQEKTQQWLEHHAHATAIEQMLSIKQCLSFIPEDKQAAYIDYLVTLNPAAAAYMEKVGQPFANLIQGEKAWDRLMALNPGDQHLPQLFKEHRENAVKNANTPGVAETMLVRFSSFFRDLGMIEQAGMTPVLDQIVSSSVKGIRQEKACLDLFVSWSLLRAGAPLRPGEQVPQTLDELDDLVFTELTTRLKLPEGISPAQRENFSDEMGGVSAFATYFVQYENSPDHLQLLQEIFMAIANGQFAEWKYGDLENLDQLKKDRMLPEKLTPEQYRSWQEDDVTDSLESLSVSAEGVALRIQQTIRNNAEHLYLGEFLTSTSSIEEAINLVAEEQKKVGKELAQFNLEFKAIRQQQPPDESLLLKKEQEKVELEVKRDYLSLIQKILKLAQVKPEELATGYFMKGKEKTGSIEDILKEISSKLQSLNERGVRRDDLDVTLLGMISTYIQELKDKGLQSKQRLTTTDSSSPKIFLEVGNNPVESCQNYAFGAYNECLLGYSEPNVKILVITNEKGNVIARSIFRLLTDTATGEPALHIEAIYSSSASETVNNLIYQHAIKKARKMGVKAFISERAQNEQGVLVEAELGEQVVTQKSDSSLESFNARAPFSYVDSAGGKREKGQYKIDNVLEVSFSVETRISQIVEDAFLGLNPEETREVVEQVVPEMKVGVDESELDEVVNFYNKHFPKSQHSREYKEALYGDETRSPVILQLRANGKLVGLLEAWDAKSDARNADTSRKLLATVVVDPEYRNQGHARRLFEEARAIVAQDWFIGTWVVHFRDSNRNTLAPMYGSWGFDELKQVAPYSNGEVKWEMEMPSSDPWRSNTTLIDTRSPQYS